jgi:hypothetical protein
MTPPGDGGVTDLGPGVLAGPDPVAALRAHRGRPVALRVPNAQHWRAVADRLRADEGGPAAGWSWAGVAKLLLDAGFLPAPGFADPDPPPPAFLAAAGPLLAHLGLDPARAARALGHRALAFTAAPLPDPPPGPVGPVTVACCVSDRAVLAANLLASPDLAPGTPHEVLAFEGASSAADGLNRALQAAKHPLVVCAHQDVYLPAGWVARLHGGWYRAAERLGPLGVAGVYGLTGPEAGPARAGRVVDREWLLAEPARLPAAARSLDELVLVLPARGPVRLDPALGWHLYGTDACLRARARGLAAAVVEAPCLHHSRGGGDLPPAFRASGRVLARAWPAALPVATPCAVIDAAWARADPVPAVPAAPAVTAAALPAAPPAADGAGLYLDLVGRCVTNWLYPEVEALVPPHAPFDPARRAAGTDWPPTAHTMIGLARVDNLRRCCEAAVREGVPGDFLEAGVWRGGAGVVMRAVLAALGDRDRAVWLADSFRGVPPPDPAKYPHDAGLDLHAHAYLAVGVDVVRAVFARYGLLDARVRFLEGWFRDTLPAAPVERLAVLRLDGDLYESTADGLTHLYPKVSPGGFVIIDDYGNIAACRAAVHDYRARHGVTEPIVPVDGAGVWWRRR